MQRVASPILALILLTGCTAPSKPAPAPNVYRSYAVLGPESQREVINTISSALEPHGISCSFEGSMGVRAECEGTAQQWEGAESTVAQLIADGLMENAVGNETN